MNGDNWSSSLRPFPCFFDRGFVSFDDVKDIRKEILRQRAEQFGKRVQNIDVDDEDEEYDED